MRLVALDMALLLPQQVASRALQLSRAMGGDNHEQLCLDEGHVPHITLAQLFVREEEMDAALDAVDVIVPRHRAFDLRVTGAARGNSSVYMEIERTPELDALHEQLMETLRGYERQGGTRAAFADGDARASDVLWVTSYRLQSAFGSFTPHVTLGHGSQPEIAPFEFVASILSACHLGRFCSCRRVLRQWRL